MPYIKRDECDCDENCKCKDDGNNTNTDNNENTDSEASGIGPYKALLDWYTWTDAERAKALSRHIEIIKLDTDRWDSNSILNTNNLNDVLSNYALTTGRQLLQIQSHIAHDGVPYIVAIYSGIHWQNLPQTYAKLRMDIASWKASFGPENIFDT